jgi:N-methylhydantoinase B
MGAGKYLGGASVRRDYRLLEEEAVLQIRSDRRAFRAYGLYGAQPGKPSWNIINPHAENQVVPAQITMTMKRGDVYRHEQPGPGGWGDPLERETWRVLQDVRNEFVSLASAREDYAVVIDSSTWTVDEEATATLRSTRRADRAWTRVPPVLR